MSAALRIGILRLTDSAPVLVAEARGYFKELGIRAHIAVEPSWANILDKLTWGLLDAAVVMPPLAIAAVLGLRGTRARLVIPMGLTSGGNSVVAGRSAWDFVSGATSGPARGASLLAWIRAQAAPPRLGVVHLYSSHNLLLRHWLGGQGGVPDRDWETVVVPPEQAVRALADGTVAGFCAGAPWGDVAETSGAGRVLLGSSVIWPGHAEKCLAVSETWARDNPDGLVALMRALLRAGAVCHDPTQAPAVAALLADTGLPGAECLAALSGGKGAEHIGFATAEGTDGICQADATQGAWFLDQMRHQGWIAAETGPIETLGLYQPDLLLPALKAERGRHVANLHNKRATNQNLPIQ